MAALVKIQLPIDIQRANETGEIWVDPKNPKVLIYDKAKRRVYEGMYPELRKRMLEADNGPGQPKGYMKAFMWANWNKAKKQWVVNMGWGFAPLQRW
jgi:hypothetical protein